MTRFIAYANFFRGTSQQKMKHVKFVFKEMFIHDIIATAS